MAAVRNAVMRERILAAATDLFVQHGLNGVSMQLIASEVGLSKAALYHYFDDKSDLLRQIFVDWAQGAYSDYERIAQSDASPIQKLESFIEMHVQNVIENLDLYSLSFREESELPEGVRAEFRTLKTRSNSVLRRILTAGVEAGAFEPHDAHLVGNAIFGMINWLWKWYKPGSDVEPHRVARAYVALIVRGIEADSRGLQRGMTVDEESQAAGNYDALSYHAEAIRHHSVEMRRLLQTMDRGHA